MDHSIAGLLTQRFVRSIRARFPEVPLIFRADSHHTKTAVLDWLETLPGCPGRSHQRG